MSNLVSVIIPCYNRAALLRQTLASCALQSHRNFEVIVVDDGSEEDLRSAVDLARTTMVLESGCSTASAKKGRRERSEPGVTSSHRRVRSVPRLGRPASPRQAEDPGGTPHQEASLDMVFCLDEQFVETVGDIRLLGTCPDGLIS